MKNIVLDPQAIEDIKWWIKQDKKLALKIMELMEELPQSPFSGKGKPEKLRFNLSGFWSRRSFFVLCGVGGSIVSPNLLSI